MRINCPYCGERNVSEFTYKGDASLERPSSADPQAFHDFVYMRDNVPGPMKEFWFHAAGCHAWLILSRHTVTHEIFEVELARKVDVGRRSRK